MMMFGVMIGILALGAVGSDTPETGKRPRWYSDSDYHRWEGDAFSAMFLSDKLKPLWYYYYYGVIPRKFINKVLGFLA